jgi:hypothetical protein
MRMIRSHLPFQIPMLIAICGLCCSPARSQMSNEQEAVIHALTLSYGQSVDKERLRFAIEPDYVLVPIFSDDGLLTEILIEPRSARDPSRVVQLSKSEFDSMLAMLASIKPLGALEEEYGVKFISGWRMHGTQRYHSAYLETAELMGQSRPLPIESARIYYLHSVTGVPKIEGDESPENFSSFGLVCIDGEHYIASRGEFTKLWSKPNERQTVEVAGPTDDPCAPDEVLFKRGVAAMEGRRFDVAHLTLETLANTYPDSEYAPKAKLLLADPRIAKCGEGLLPPDICKGEVAGPVPPR